MRAGSRQRGIEIAGLDVCGVEADAGDHCAVELWAVSGSQPEIRGDLREGAVGRISRPHPHHVAHGATLSAGRLHQVWRTLGDFEPVGTTPKRSSAIDMMSWNTGAAVTPPPAFAYGLSRTM